MVGSTREESTKVFSMKSHFPLIRETFNSLSKDSHFTVYGMQNKFNIFIYTYTCTCKDTCNTVN